MTKQKGFTQEFTQEFEQEFEQEFTQEFEDEAVALSRTRTQAP